MQIMAQKDKIISETQEKLDIYKSALNGAKQFNRALVIVLLVAMFVLYGMTDYFLLPDTLLFRH